MIRNHLEKETNLFHSHSSDILEEEEEKAEMDTQDESAMIDNIFESPGYT